MNFMVRVDEDRKITIPPDALDALQRAPDRSTEVEARTLGVSEPYVFDEAGFDAAVREYSGSMREQMLAEGYASVDDFMNEIRPPW